MDKNKERIHKVLGIITNLLKRMGMEKNIISKDVYQEMIQAIGENDEKEGMEACLSQIQKVNIQMENMSWLNEHYKILHEFAQVCSKTLNEEVLLKKAFEMVSQVMPTDSFFIALYDESDPLIHFIFMVENGIFYPNDYIKLGNNFTSKAIQTKEIVHPQKLKQDQTDATFGVTDSKSGIFVPVIIDDHVKAVISAQSVSDFAYRKEHEELLQIIGNQVINSIETARLYEKIYLMSQTDELTGLKNHRAFHNDLSKLISSGSKKITLIMIDSDRLKKVNDTFGHDIGDLYLKVLADGIKSICDEHIIGYRYAGDEFMIILHSPSSETSEGIHQKLVNYLKTHPIIIDDNEITVRISSGVAVYPENGSTVDSLKRAADQAQYRAKNLGGSRLINA
ncbi:diguanylate cyclase (GGDEF)-like protein [Cytobacillus eiseniae]|uniref:Diguanylate cyclase (GGDEF)-like protein n=1 Tax=Cytobacillus eiseniae TaxID=762947 RepID=A0ABS4R9P4_9BACI|nr:sensor domain-containing diguanylate cyclase [Cytobacillus eiseniae]MBP2239613.1 diguanylate cyclase (GGDEF)-like protein [Cytobacillus eiseniae]